MYQYHSLWFLIIAIYYPKALFQLLRPHTLLVQVEASAFRVFWGVGLGFRAYTVDNINPALSIVRKEYTILPIV